VEIPLVLTSPKPDRLVYGFPVWYRIVMGTILAIVAAALLLGDTRPGALAWLVMIILLLGTFYEDKWSFDGADQSARHQAGLMFLSRSRVVPFVQIERLRIVPLVRGTIPGSEDEKAANEAALKGTRTDDPTIKRERHKKPFLSLEIECADGTRFLVDHMPARKAEKLRSLASRIAEHCGKPVVEA